MEHGTWGASTHAGLIREANEDHHLVGPPVFAVADGMGGHASGALASQLCITVLQQLTAAAVTRADVLHHIRRADTAIADAARAPEHAGMGTTLCVVAIVGSGSSCQILVANVGDSRVLRLRDGEVVQLTVDHTVVSELLATRRISEAEAATHPHRHVLTRCLGAGGRLDIDWWLLPPHPDDVYVLASDGLTNEVDEDGIRRILTSSPTADDAARRLVEAALDRGGRDNASVVVVVPGVGSGPAADGHQDADIDTEPTFGRSMA